MKTTLSVVLSAALALCFCTASMAIDLTKGQHTPRVQTAPQTPANPGVFDGAVGQQATTAVALTRQECVGLGGKVITSFNCSLDGQKACATVDRDGVIRTQCIDEVAE